MHLLVLSAFRPFDCPALAGGSGFGSQCTFWCSVLSDADHGDSRGAYEGVSMHLLVLSAFRPRVPGRCQRQEGESQCTFWCSVLSDSERGHNQPPERVSMHLLVLSAFRLVMKPAKVKSLFRVSMHLLVLSAFRHHINSIDTIFRFASQCTFWCSVLSDNRAIA